MIEDGQGIAEGRGRVYPLARTLHRRSSQRTETKHSNNGLPIWRYGFGHFYGEHSGTRIEQCLRFIVGGLRHIYGRNDHTHTKAQKHTNQKYGAGLSHNDALALPENSVCSPQRVRRLNWRDPLFGEARPLSTKLSHSSTAAAKKIDIVRLGFPHWESANLFLTAGHQSHKIVRQGASKISGVMAVTRIQF